MSVTWVVGGTSGIGEACANLLKTMGEDVLATGRDVDVRRQRPMFDFLGFTGKNRNGGIDKLIYSAGVTKLDWSMDVESEDMLRLYHINVVGLINVLQIIPLVKRVVVIGSDAAWREMRTSLAYCASKAALHQAVRVIARERASDDFAINVIAPGMTEPTGMQSYIDKKVPMIRDWDKDDAREYEKSQIPMGRRADVTEVADVAVSVLLSTTNYLNGAIIPVNGGR